MKGIKKHWIDLICSFEPEDAIVPNAVVAGLAAILILQIATTLMDKYVYKLECSPQSQEVVINDE